MKKYVNQPRVTVPTVFVTKNKHRVKQYDNVVYLKDGDEFELELFNPTSRKVLAKITLNDFTMDSGIVLRPGERVFLERYLNEARKFIFDTYEVDKKDSNVQNAIRDNGKVEVKFYEEAPNNNIIWNHPGTYTYNPSVYYYDNHTTIGGGPSFGCTTTTSGGMEIGSARSGSEVKCFATNTAGLDMSDLQMDMTPISENLEETGRIEKGSHSNQNFEYDSTSFNVWHTWSTEWKILPKSQKAFVKEELAVFCTGCGAKRKKGSHKFCPHCGNQF